ncbi:MAG: NUDIX hydrolase [Chloroflexi bacterium]|nr:NUDIX hydrolase [Chloroflexota bacterium]
MQPRPEVPRVMLGAGIIIIAPDDRLLLVQQEHNGIVDWGSLGGGLEHGESIEECAVREAHEESGLRVRLLRLLSVDQFWHAGLFRGVGFVFLAEPDPWPQRVTLPEIDGKTRFLDYRWVTRAEAPAYVSQGSYDLWRHHWPPDLRETLIRKHDFAT